VVINVNVNGFTNLFCSQCEDTMFEGTCRKRQVNAVLGNLVRLYYLGEVPRSGDTRSTATCWANYGLSPNATYGTTQGQCGATSG
jgi:hypothetical protein